MSASPQLRDLVVGNIPGIHTYILGYEIRENFQHLRNSGSGENIGNERRK